MLALILATVLVTAPTSDAVSANGQANDSAAQVASTMAADDGIGTVIKVDGSVTAATEDGNTRTLAPGDVIYSDETLSTDANSTLQIELHDESTFTISENTTMSVDDFAYSETEDNPNLAAKVTKGIFRYVSGKVEKANPEKVNIDVPSGTIGIRGTIVVGEINGEDCLIALEPEEDGSTPHKIVVFNEEGGQRQEVEITQPGFATRIEARGRAPQALFQLPEEKQSQFRERLPQAPKFPEGTRPGDPKRYEQIFDTGKMKERMAQREMKREGFESGNRPEAKNAQEKKLTQGEPDQNRRERNENDPRNMNDGDDQKVGGPQPPQGPDGNDFGQPQGFDREPKQKDFGAPKFGKFGPDQDQPRNFDQGQQGPNNGPKQNFGQPRFGNFGNAPTQDSAGQPQQQNPGSFRPQGPGPDQGPRMMAPPSGGDRGGSRNAGGQFGPGGSGGPSGPMGGQKGNGHGNGGGSGRRGGGPPPK